MPSWPITFATRGSTAGDNGANRAGRSGSSSMRTIWPSYHSGVSRCFRNFRTSISSHPGENEVQCRAAPGILTRVEAETHAESESVLGHVVQEVLALVDIGLVIQAENAIPEAGGDRLIEPVRDQCVAEPRELRAAGSDVAADREHPVLGVVAGEANARIDVAPLIETGDV